jgi:hypothetical protein
MGISQNSRVAGDDNLMAPVVFNRHQVPNFDRNQNRIAIKIRIYFALATGVVRNWRLASA